MFGGSEKNVFFWAYYLNSLIENRKSQGENLPVATDRFFNFFLFKKKEKSNQ